MMMGMRMPVRKPILRWRTLNSAIHLRTALYGAIHLWALDCAIHLRSALYCAVHLGSALYCAVHLGCTLSAVLCARRQTHGLSVVQCAGASLGGTAGLVRPNGREN
ncbi:hypothetical protein M8J75_004072 [Diaphorina citri]|nr:hypothetical protein M8J75_004072 [Diaphorina citri]KAI5707661.1 hypothetical protein M8J77_006933 [Diaphorina citri]